MCVRLVSFHYLQTHDRNIRGWIFTQWWIIIILKQCSVTYLFSGNLWIFLFIQHTSWCNAFYSICFLYWYFWIQVQYLLEQKLFCLDSCSLYIFICSFVCFYVEFSIIFFFFFTEHVSNYWIYDSEPQHSIITMKPELTLVSLCNDNQILCDTLTYMHCSIDNKWSPSGFRHNNVRSQPNVKIYKQMKQTFIFQTDMKPIP